MDQTHAMADYLSEISDPFLVVDGDWRIVYANPAAEGMFDREPHEVLGRFLWDELPEFANSFYQGLAKAASERRAAVLEEYYPPLSRWYEIRVYPSERGLALYFLDVSDRRPAG